MTAPSAPTSPDEPGTAAPTGTTSASTAPASTGTASAAGASATASANPRAWHHAMLGGVAVFLAVGVAGVVWLVNAAVLIVALGAFAGTALAAVLAERAPTRWPWYAYLVMPVGAVAVLQALLSATR